MSLYLDTNYKDFQNQHASKMDEQLLVRFFFREREDKAATLAEGRPVYKEVEYMEVRIPGARDAQACGPVTFHDTQRFPRHYESFKKRISMPESGTLLGQWPQISRSQVEELAYVNIKTVEALADVSDSHAGKMQGGYTLKKRAQEWLKCAGETALIAEKEAMANKISELEAKLDRVLSAQMAPAPVFAEPVQAHVKPVEAHVKPAAAHVKPAEATKRTKK